MEQKGKLVKKKNQVAAAKENRGTAGRRKEKKKRSAEVVARAGQWSLEGGGQRRSVVMYEGQGRELRVRTVEEG